ncbi:DUF3383 family protein [Fructobacillus tropaeoli]|uniref:DUF3383 family protein n=1 Tax=Fructobacillus tropaeoli TaxID=709323 RepID=A0ABM9MN88_9LACO|nr:DUF3383 family protein [Fructobacillus tropaeoli]GIC70617.1 hypothetical protein FT12353_12930 [Fructobacillus tropaeoli]CAK1228360.1 hypothetical protein R53137_KAKDMLNK_00228 [Fructobacillus tropaeoli]CAK1235112.1 hypothetical protein LMG30238_FMBOGHMB_00637 [Fructobacillus tropaeoli]
MSIEALQSDVDVVISAQSPVIAQGLGTPAIFTKKTGGDPSFKPTLQEFNSSTDVATAFGSGSTVSKVAQLIFAQSNRPDHVDIIQYTDIETAVNMFADADWMFALLDDVSDQNEVATFAGATTEIGDKFTVVQVSDSAKLSSLSTSKNLIAFVHPLDKGRLDAAAVGNIANLQPGSTTWKFRSVTGIAPNGYTSSELGQIKKANGISYVKAVGGAYMLSEGWTITGDYIDEIHARIWIENEIKASLQELLTNTAKLSYDQRGIIQIQSAIDLVLMSAANNGIIATDDKTGRPAYVVTATPRSSQSSSDVHTRTYRGAAFKYVQAGAIHNIVVSGQIADAI